MFHSIFAGSVPLVFASIGALFTDLAGCLCIAIEGFMVLGAFFSWFFALGLNSIFLGTVLAVLMTSLIGFLTSVFIQKAKANPFVTGLALNLAASGAADTVSELFFDTKGVLRSSTLGTLSSVIFPFAQKSPFFDKLLNGHSVFEWLMLAVLISSAIIIKKTPLGLRLRSVGKNEVGALEHGIRVANYKNASWAVAGALAAAAGATLTWSIGSYVPGGTADRPWRALAAVFLGFKNIWGVGAAAVFFAFAEIVVFNAQKAAFIPITILLGLPSFLALVLYAVSQAIKKRIGT
jgi:simple sugar transport system permease protein